MKVTFTKKYKVSNFFLYFAETIQYAQSLQKGFVKLKSEYVHSLKFFYKIKI